MLNLFQYDSLTPTRRAPLPFFLWESAPPRGNFEQKRHCSLSRLLEGSEKFSHPESRGKISNVTITELFYSHTLNMNRDSLHTRSFKRVEFSVFRYRGTRDGFAGPKSYRVFRETGTLVIKLFGFVDFNYTSKIFRTANRDQYID